MTKLICILALLLSVIEISALDLFSKHRVLKEHGEPKLIKIDIEHQKYENHPNHRTLTQIHRDSKKNYKNDNLKPKGVVTHHSQIPSNIEDSPHLISLTAYHRDQHLRPYENNLVETYDELNSEVSQQSADPSEDGNENEDE